jgi:MFS family permease
MQAAAVLWHINTLSNQPIALGGVGLVQIAPVLLLSLVAGVTADSLDRRRLILLTQSSLAALAGLLGWMTLRGTASIPAIYAIIAISAAVLAFDAPARQSLIPNLVPARALTNAFSLSSIARHFGAVLGPTVGGIILASFGVGYAYLLNAISYLGVILALVLMGPIPQHTTVHTPVGPKQTALRRSALDGLRFVRSQPIILSSMLLDFFATFFSSATYLLPIFATEILASGPQGYGWLVSAPSIGAGLVALWLAFRERIRSQGPVLLYSVGIFGLSSILFGLSRSFWLTFAALALNGAADGVSTIIRNTIRQLQTPDHLRGRMTSVNQMFFMGGPQLGELEAGLLAQWIGAPLAVVSGGVLCLLTLGGITVRYPQLRRYSGDEPIRAGVPGT